MCVFSADTNQTRMGTQTMSVSGTQRQMNVRKRKRERVLIIAIVMFGILLLVIQFSKHLGIRGFP
ncbi:MAG: hypothetical protein B6D35_12165 [Candidatus Brocadia sp. UTAMX2]|nr:MAG: hypothetical protein B6D35_12165 [Candidatus Brocadia sp. UTAMX2]